MNPESLTKALYRIAIGFGILCFDINLGPINILPNWLGYWLIVKSLDAVAEEEPSAALLKPLGNLLIVWFSVTWVMKILGMNLRVTLVNWVAYLVAVEQLYFQFQLLTNIAAIAKKYVPQFERRILRLRTVMTLVVTGYTLLSAFVVSEAVLIVVAVVQLVAAIWLWRTLLHMEDAMSEVFGLKSRDLTFAERIQMNTETPED